jgi:hypothetical protein
MTSRLGFSRALATRPRREDSMLVLRRLWRDVEVARRAIARGRTIAITHTARGVLSGLASLRVRVELAHAAAAFADARDDRPFAEEWVRFALTARATLEHARKSGAAVLAEELEELDECFEDAREAVLLLAPEDYREALGGTPPKTRAWWGERARLDAGFREIDLERALGALAPA